MVVKSQSVRQEKGSALLIVFVMAAFIAIMLYKEMPVSAFEAQRQKEQLLVDRGAEYKRAVKLFYLKFNGQYPASIDQLENTNRLRFLRHRFKDPFTGKDDWRLLHMGPGGMLTDSKVNPLPIGNQGTSSFASNGSGFGAQQGNNNSGLANTSSFGSNSSFGSSSSFGNNSASGSNSSFGGNPSFSSNSSAGNNSSFGSNSSFGNSSSFGNNSSSGNNSSFGSSSFGSNSGNPSNTSAPQQAVSLGMPTAYTTPGMPVVYHDYPANGGNGGSMPIRQRPPAIPANGGAGTTAVNPNDPNGIGISSQFPGQNSLLGVFGQQQNGAAQLGNGAQDGTIPQSPFGNGNPIGGPNAAGQLNPGDPNAGANTNPMLNQIRQQLTGGANSPFQAPQNVSSTNGPTVIGGGLAGVASKAAGHTIKLVEDQQDLGKWEFYYDPRKDVVPSVGAAGGGLPAGGMQQMNSPNFWNGTTNPQAGAATTNVFNNGSSFSMTPPNTFNNTSQQQPNPQQANPPQ